MGAGLHRAHPRSALRGREAPRPQAPAASTRPTFRVVINERVCEGCGDCGDKSNCLSVQPVDTPFGRKTRIDQGSCNFDLSCLQGDCPSFMKVPTRPAAHTPTDAPHPSFPLRCRRDRVEADECTIRLSGIGGTGVVTTSQILGTAAMLQGYHVRGLDQTGLSQKAGPVVSDLRLSRTVPHAVEQGHRRFGRRAPRVRPAGGRQRRHDAHARPRSAPIVVANIAAVPTGSMVVHPDRPYPVARAHRAARPRTPASR